jgi:hypothetical protein
LPLPFCSSLMVFPSSDLHSIVAGPLGPTQQYPLSHGRGLWWDNLLNMASEVFANVRLLTRAVP